jgi:hypothetical protein
VRKIPLLSYNQEIILPCAQDSNTNSIIPIGSQLGQMSALKPPLPPRAELLRQPGPRAAHSKTESSSPEETDIVKPNSEKNTLPKHLEGTEQEREDTKNTCHITYTPNLIPNPHMQQRETRKGEQRKKETSAPNVPKTRAYPSPPTKDACTDAKK